MSSISSKKTVSLVLGSGGARGLAHIGVIKELEANGYQISSISGCSIGSLIGGIYAAGKLNHFEEWVCGLNKFDIVSLLDFAWGKNGLVKGDKIINHLIDLVGDTKIEDLPITYTALAADIKNEKEVWLNKGSLFDAIRASISLPLFFTPFNYNGIQLIDGGVLNPVPIAPTFTDNTDLTIAVNLGGTLLPQNEILLAKTSTTTTVPSSIRKGIESFIQSISSSSPTKSDHDWSMYDVANQAFDAMQSTIARQKLAAYPPDIEIKFARNMCGTFDFDLAEKIIDTGRQRTRETLKIN